MTLQRATSAAFKMRSFSDAENLRSVYFGTDSSEAPWRWEALLNDHVLDCLSSRRCLFSERAWGQRRGPGRFGDGIALSQPMGWSVAVSRGVRCS